jgi:hypothetical protein
MIGCGCVFAWGKSGGRHAYIKLSILLCTSTAAAAAATAAGSGGDWTDGLGCRKRSQRYCARACSPFVPLNVLAMGPPQFISLFLAPPFLFLAQSHH